MMILREVVLSHLLQHNNVHIYIQLYSIYNGSLILNGFGMSAVQTNPYHSRLFSPCATRLWIGSA